MKRLLTLTAVAATLSLGSVAFAGPGPGHPFYRGGLAHAKRSVNVEKPYALTGDAVQTREYRWERDERQLAPRPNLHRTRFVRVSQ